MRLLSVLILAVALTAPPAAAVPVPGKARALDTSHLDRWVGTTFAGQRSPTVRSTIAPELRAHNQRDDDAQESESS
jgi:hypothetical protein